MKVVTYTGPEDETIVSDAFQIEVDGEVHTFARDIPSEPVSDAAGKACQDYDGFNFEVKPAPKDEPKGAEA